MSQAEPIIPSAPQLAAKSYLLIDADTGKVIVEKNSEQRLPPASLTKIMVSYVAAAEIANGKLSLSDEALISEKAWRVALDPEQSRMFIEVDTRVSVEDLLRGIVIQSGNDATLALAEHISGSEESFVDVMNQYADRLGLENTQYQNVAGLTMEGHYTTAQDLAKLSVSLINKYPSHYAMYKEKFFTYNDIRQGNRNPLLWRDNTVDGVKTGHTSAAGYCLVASARRDGMRLISVVMGTDSEQMRATESQKLLTYGFRYFETVSLYKAGASLSKSRVWGGTHAAINIGIAEDLKLTIPRGAREQLTAHINLQPEIHAPLADGQQLGTLTVSRNDETMAEVPLLALNAVEEAGFFSRIWDSVSLFFLKLFGGDPLAT